MRLGPFRNRGELCPAPGQDFFHVALLVFLPQPGADELGHKRVSVRTVYAISIAPEPVILAEAEVASGAHFLSQQGGHKPFVGEVLARVMLSVCPSSVAVVGYNQHGLS